MKDTFTLTADHLKLLSRMYVNWGYAETGAPEIDPKRPYGNSNVTSDVAEILGIDAPDEDEASSAEVDKFAERMYAIHRQTKTALQIVLVTGQFVPGTYRKADTYDDRSWELVS